MISPSSTGAVGVIAVLHVDSLPVARGCRLFLIMSSISMLLLFFFFFLLPSPLLLFEIHECNKCKDGNYSQWDQEIEVPVGRLRTWSWFQCWEGLRLRMTDFRILSVEAALNKTHVVPETNSCSDFLRAMLIRVLAHYMKPLLTQLIPNIPVSIIEVLVCISHMCRSRYPGSFVGWPS